MIKMKCEQAEQLKTGTFQIECHLESINKENGRNDLNYIR